MGEQYTVQDVYLEYLLNSVQVSWWGGGGGRGGVKLPPVIILLLLLLFLPLLRYYIIVWHPVREYRDYGHWSISVLVAMQIPYLLNVFKL